MPLPKGFIIREGQTLRSDVTLVDWRIMVAGRRFCQMAYVDNPQVTMRYPVSHVRARFTPTEAGV